MLNSEKKTLRRFFAIYIVLVVTLIVAVATIYYNAYNERMKLEYKTLMQDFAILQTKKLKWLHNHFPKYNEYPRDNRYNSAIYDLEYTEIFSTMHCRDINFNNNLYFTKNYVVYFTVLSDYYLGAKYLFIEVPKSDSMTVIIYEKIALYSIIALIIFLIIGYFLAKLFIKPMKESIRLLDNFIKDATHEINTPISIINTNIEMVDSSNLTQRENKILNRVKIASRTLETVYKDLKFTTLENGNNQESKEFNLKDIVLERVEYFSLLTESKKLTINLKLEDLYIVADSKLIARLVDNLISNAIKYNRNGGIINISISKKKLTVEDSGIGIKKENLDKLFTRYSRFNNSEGGFGLGLNIVKQIVDIYNLKIDITSELEKGTKVVVQW